jgi:carbon-monoxide dehydrogenase large subunit
VRAALWSAATGYAWPPMQSLRAVSRWPVGQALFENMVYDGQSGQLITGSFLDYGMPRAADFPEFVSELLEVPAKTNPLGIKGIGEAGTIAAPPTVVNAVIDALKEFGVTHLDMPLTSERVWAAMNSREENA